MYKGKSFLAIIPARSGSKAIENKNIKILVDKPLMAYTIEAAVKTNVFDRIILSTDSREYAEIGEQFKATVPFLRDSNLSTDNATTSDVIIDVIEKLKAKGEVYDYFVLLQPTSPLRTETHILKAIEEVIEKDGNSLVSICELEHSTQINIKLNSSGTLDNLFNDKRSVRRQDFQKEYRINGAIYIGRVEYFTQEKSFFKEKSYPYIMSRLDSIDIDTIEDFIYAQWLLSRR